MRFDESRREFIKKSIGIGLGVYGLTRLEYPIVGISEARSYESRVVVARDKGVIDSNFKVDFGVVRRLLDDAITKLAGTGSASEAWKRFFRSDDIVGIKVNTLSGKWMSSHPELVAAIVEGLRSAGVKDIIIWDRTDQGLEEAGFKISKKRTNDPRCFGTSPDFGYEKDVKIYGSIASCLSRIVSYCTAFVNVPVLKHHTMAGVTISLKNWFGAINNPNKYHFDGSGKMVAFCNYVPDLNSMIFSALGKKQTLIVCDGIMSQYDIGPGYRPSKAWKYSGLLVSTDPVALDRTGTQIIEKKRQDAGLKSLSDPSVNRKPEYISIAADRFHRLGTDDPSKIELISTGNLAPEI